jgi:hypothetical protein
MQAAVIVATVPPGGLDMSAGAQLDGSSVLGLCAGVSERDTERHSFRS